MDDRSPQGIIWLASYPRSGNTWIRVFLTNLRRIIDGQDAALDLDSMDPAVALWDNEAALYNRLLGKPVSTATGQEIMRARSWVLAQLAEDAGGLLLMKTHNANVMFGGFATVPPSLSAGAIYVVRNPLDCIISCAEFWNISLDEAIGRAAQSGAMLTGDAENRRIFTLMGSWSENVSTWTALASPALLVVRYEDLLDRPTESFGAIAAHLRMNHTVAHLSEAIEQSSFRRLQDIEGKRGFHERPESAARFFREGRKQQWRERLTPAQVDRVVAAHGDQMSKFGYLPG